MIMGKKDELDGRNLYSLYISNHLHFNEYTLGSTALKAMEIRLELRPGEVGTIVR